MLRTGLIAGGGLLLLGGGGTALALDFRRKIVEQDLTVIGNGVPAVVQIHDPTCMDCASLQKQTRRALKGFGEDEVQFRVANIASDTGSAFQGRQGLPHVTLALFDGTGQRIHVVRGVQKSVEDLRDILRSRLLRGTNRSMSIANAAMQLFPKSG